jgi:hypothetical protein
MLKYFKKSVWINPEPEKNWSFTPSVKLTYDLMEGRMFPLTLDGLSGAIKELH